MLILLSPAKTLDMQPPASSASTSTSAGCADAADELVGELQKLSVPQLKALLGVSDALARLNHGRYSEWGSQPEKQAALAFDGPAYKALSASTLGSEELRYLQSHLRILCGLYGLLRPLDLVKPYRLDMSKRLANCRGRDLYAFWRERITQSLARELEEQPEESRFVVDCASLEYSRAVDRGALGAPVYTLAFPGPAVYAKQARGSVVRFAAVTCARSPADFRRFTGRSGEWAFAEARSSEHTFVFLRTAGTAGTAGTVAKAATADVGPAGANGGEPGPGRAAPKHRRTAGKAGKAGRAAAAAVGPADADGGEPGPGRVAPKRQRRR